MELNGSQYFRWVGWNAGRVSFVLSTPDKFGRKTARQPVPVEDLFVEVTRQAWERYAANQDWKPAAALGKRCTEKRPELAYGWENWAWAVHKTGDTAKAYKILAPILKKLKLAGPPSGRGAYCLSCFCGALGKRDEAVRWLRLAYATACDKEAFKTHVIHEPDLRDVWPGLPQFAEAALAVLE